MQRIQTGNRTGHALLHHDFEQAFDEALNKCQPHTYRSCDRSWLSPVGHIIEYYQNAYDGLPMFAPEQVSRPMMFVCSADDVESPPEISHEISQRLGGPNMVLTQEGVTHFWIFEYPRIAFLTRLLDEFKIFCPAAAC